MKRKCLLYLLILVMSAAALLSAGCNKASEEYWAMNGIFAHTYGNLEYAVVNGEVYIKFFEDGNGVTTLEIPDEIDGMPVVKIQDYGCFNSTKLKVIKIGKNIREIASWSFTNNQALEAFEVDEDNQFFKAVDGVLYNKDCTELIYFPPAKGRLINSVKTSIGTTKTMDAFGLAAGESREAVCYKVLDTCTSIRTKAFYKCYYIEQVILPDGLVSIGEKAFFNCSRLISFASEAITLTGAATNGNSKNEVYESYSTAALPNSLITIEKDAFSFCSSLKSIIIPFSVVNMGDYVFYNSTALLDVTLRKNSFEVSGWGKKWWPTQNGSNLEGLVIHYADKDESFD